MAITNLGEEHNFKFGIMLIVVLIIVMLAIFAVYMFRVKQSVTDQNQTTTETPGFFDRLFGEETNEPLIKDSDKDGLANSDEEKNGTDAFKADSDADGLTDREEKIVYTTDPAKADSDNDGMKDGEEIQNRRDPKNGNPEAEWPPRPAQFTTASN